MKGALQGQRTVIWAHSHKERENGPPTTSQSFFSTAKPRKATSFSPTEWTQQPVPPSLLVQSPSPRKLLNWRHKAESQISQLWLKFNRVLDNLLTICSWFQFCQKISYSMTASWTLYLPRLFGLVQLSSLTYILVYIKRGGHLVWPCHCDKINSYMLAGQLPVQKSGRLSSPACCLC